MGALEPLSGELSGLDVARALEEVEAQEKKNGIAKMRGDLVLSEK